MVVVFRRLHLAAYLACSASSQAAARDECRLLRTSSSSMLVFKALAASASSSSLVAQAAMLALPSCVPRAKISCRVLACSSLLDSTLEEEEEEEVEELVVVVQEEEELGVVVVVDCIMQWSWEWRFSVASCFSTPVLHDEEEEEEEFFLDSLVGVELGTVITLLVSGEEGRELIGLPKLGVVALKGVAVRDGSTLAIGVISVPMSRVDTTTSAPPPPPLVFTARDDDESAAAPG